MSSPPEPSPPAPADHGTPVRGRLSAALEVLARSEPEGGLRIRHLFETLAGSGHAALLVVSGFAFVLPLPGIGLILGLLLMFVGLRIAFGHRPWLPPWLLDKPLRPDSALSLARKLAAFERRTHKLLRPRLVVVCRDPRMHRVNGLVVALLGILLTLPIPFTNIPLAVPVLLIGLGLLEDDGLLLILGHALSIFAFGLFVALFWFGGLSIEHVWRAWQKQLD